MTRRASAWACAALAAYIAVCLAIDLDVGHRGQLEIGVVTCTLVLAVVACLPPRRRLEVALVVAIATCAEVTGALVWGTFTYRLGNLPLFVPPGHALLYLMGLLLVRAVPHLRTIAWTAFGVVAVWALAGITVASRADWGGALGVAVLAVVLIRGRATPAYAGVFLVVTALELYGTGIGSWSWAATVPGTGIPNGDPPSGVAGGYLLIDATALALAPYIVAACSLPRPGRSVGELLLRRRRGALLRSARLRLPAEPGLCRAADLDRGRGLPLPAGGDARHGRA